MLYESPAFRLEADDRVGTLWLDFRGRASQSLNLQTLNELTLVLDRASDLPLDVLVLRSGRPGVFLDAFDLNELAGFQSALEFAAFATRGQELTRRLAELPFPTIAVLDGRCAGAGLELALACSARFAVDAPGTVFAFSEVARGLMPCWGSSQRLPQLIGPRLASRMIVAGQELDTREAFSAGLVDRTSPLVSATVEARAFIDAVQDRGRAPTRFNLRRWFATRLPMNCLRRQINEARPNSAGRSALEAMIAGYASLGEALAAERTGLSRLAATRTTRNLLDLAHRAAAPIRVYPEPTNPLPPRPKRIGIVGGGHLGIALAGRLAGFGHEIVVQERHADVAEEVTRRVAIRFPELAQSIRATADWVGFEHADFAIEAAEEDPGIKRNIFAELERRLRPRTILATASSTISVEVLADELARPGRVAGLHLPNLNDGTPLAEIVGGPATDSSTLTALIAWSRAWGFTPVRTADRPGRLTRLLQLTYLSEGVGLVAEGLPPQQVDLACRNFGFARGPLEWCDEIGLDRLAELAAQMQLARGGDVGFARNLLFLRLLPYGWVGRESGEGFYRYRRTTSPNEIARMVLWRDLDEDAVAHYVFDPAEAIREGLERIVLRTVNDAASCLVDEPDSDPATVDLALAYGMGWAPMLGGPLRYADEFGLANVVERLGYFAERFGPRFTPCDELIRRAEAGESFHGLVEQEAVASPAWRMVG